MSKLVTLEQAKNLKELGFNNSTLTIHEALEWFREVKGIECAVSFSLSYRYPLKDFPDILVPVFGGYRWFYAKTNNSGIEFSSNVFSEYSLAESALLDSLIEYVSK